MNRTSSIILLSLAFLAGFLSHAVIQMDSLAKSEDEIYAKRDVLIDKLVKRIEQKTESEQLFIIRWYLK